MEWIQRKRGGWRKTQAVPTGETVSHIIHKQEPITHYISNGLLTQGRDGSKSTGWDGKEVGVGVIKSGGPYWGVGW